MPEPEFKPTDWSSNPHHGPRLTHLDAARQHIATADRLDDEGADADVVAVALGLGIGHALLGIAESLDTIASKPPVGYVVTR